MGKGGEGGVSRKTGGSGAAHEARNCPTSLGFRAEGEGGGGRGEVVARGKSEAMYWRGKGERCGRVNRTRARERKGGDREGREDSLCLGPVDPEVVLHHVGQKVVGVGKLSEHGFALRRGFHLQTGRQGQAQPGKDRHSQAMLSINYSTHRTAHDLPIYRRFFCRSSASYVTCSFEVLCRSCTLRIQPRKYVLDGAHYTAPTRQHELDHTGIP